MCVVNKDFSALKNDFNGPSENNFCSGLQFLTKRKKKKTSKSLIRTSTLSVNLIAIAMNSAKLCRHKFHERFTVYSKFKLSVVKSIEAVHDHEFVKKFDV